MAPGEGGLQDQARNVAERLVDNVDGVAECDVTKKRWGKCAAHLLLPKQKSARATSMRMAGRPKAHG